MATSTVDFVPDPKLRFESHRVKILLQQFGHDDAVLADTIRTVREASAARGTDPYLTFNALYDLAGYESFPVRFHCHHVGGIDELKQFSAAFRIDNTYLVSSLLSRRAVQFNDGRETVVISNMPSVKGGVAVHTFANAMCVRGETILKCNVPDIGIVHVQPYKSFAWWVATKWMRGEPLTSQTEADDDTQLFRTLTPGTAYLYVWLRSKWREFAAAEALDGTSYMRLTHSLIAENSGLSLAVVKRGLDRLKQENLIATRKGDHCIHVAVVG